MIDIRTVPLEELFEMILFPLHNSQRVTKDGLCKGTRGISQPVEFDP